MAWIYYIALIAVQFTGLMLTLLGLPGNWLMIGALAGYAWLTGFDRYVGWPSIVTVLALGAVADVLEFLTGSAGAKRAGGSKRAMLGAVVGAVVGAICFTALLPIPVLGTIFGVCLGAFLGAALVEMGVVGDAAHATRVGWGAAKGRFWGIVLKLLFGVTILIASICAAVPW